VKRKPYGGVDAISYDIATRRAAEALEGFSIAVQPPAPFTDREQAGEVNSEQMVEQARHLFPRVCQILDVVKREWTEAGCWSEWDERVRDEITAWQKSAEMTASTSTEVQP